MCDAEPVSWVSSRKRCCGDMVLPSWCYWRISDVGLVEGCCRDSSTEARHLHHIFDMSSLPQREGCLRKGPYNALRLIGGQFWKDFDWIVMHRNLDWRLRGIIGA